MKFNFLSFVRTISAASCLFAVIYYGKFFWDSISRYWFHPGWATDDALQQVYPFYKAINPNLFQGDLITGVMEGYLPPVHYWLSFFITKLTASPIMMAHWLMLLQIVILFIFIFLTVFQRANFSAACLVCLWFLHTRPFMQRMTGGLPRGWAAPVLAAFLYFLLKNDHKKILIVLFLGCLLHPPATMIAAVTYGPYLLYQTFLDRSFLKPLLTLILLAPLYIGTVYYVVKRPAEIGDMVTLAEAEKLPEFSRPFGRFPFVPLESVYTELDQFAIQPFKSRLYSPTNELSKLVREFMIHIVVGLSLIVLIIYRKFVPKQLLVYFISIALVYEASRLLAFRLYVPDRHLQMPLSLFWGLFFGITLFSKAIHQKKYVVLSCFITTFIAGLSWLGAGSGLQGDLNFNYSQDKHGKIFIYIRANLPEKSLIAGHPTLIDGLQLFGQRTAFATTETAHPFYQGYFKEIVRRLKISFEAHYARDLKTFVNLLTDEKIDYFVFSRRAFYPEVLSKTNYQEPLKQFVEKLASYPPEDYLYKQIVGDINFPKSSYVLYQDRQSLLIDVKELKKSAGIE